ncbi:MAG: hypothetical protein AB9834_16670 [Lentimicrobium sp.]
MDADIEIPLPIRFNLFKHHRNYMLDMLSEASPEAIIDMLGPVCNNYIDVYTGTMMPAIICDSVIALLKSMQVLQNDEFTQWVASKNGYRKIRLEEGSEWIVRKSDEPGRYVHLHPARTGPFTIRFKGSTLKTVYLLKASFGGRVEYLSQELINNARSQINLSPVSGLHRCKGIINCYRIFQASQRFTGD